jgi:hypothetical protein
MPPRFESRPLGHPGLPRKEDSFEVLAIHGIGLATDHAKAPAVAGNSD